MLRANRPNFFKVLMGQEKKNELLKLYVWDEKEGPMETAKALEERERRDVNVPFQ